MVLSDIIYALIDYENISSLEGINLDKYEKIIVFTGALQDAIKIPATTLVSELSIRVVRVSAVSKNNVDFHLVLELGLLSGTLHDDIKFHVISNDKGYDDVIAYLCKLGRDCVRVTPAQPIKTKINPPANQTPDPKLTVYADIVNKQVQHLLKCCRESNNMPSKYEALTSWLKCHMRSEWTPERELQIKSILKQQGVIHLSGEKITWIRAR